MLALDDARVVCRAPSKKPSRRTIERDWQRLLPSAPSPAGVDAASSTPDSRGGLGRVSELLKHADDAVRESRFADAYSGYSSVLALDPDHELARRNLQRLHRLGFGRDGESSDA